MEQHDNKVKLVKSAGVMEIFANFTLKFDNTQDQLPHSVEILHRECAYCKLQCDLSPQHSEVI